MKSTTRITETEFFNYAFFLESPYPSKTVPSTVCNHCSVISNEKTRSRLCCFNYYLRNWF